MYNNMHNIASVGINAHSTSGYWVTCSGGDSEENVLFCVQIWHVLQKGEDWASGLVALLPSTIHDSPTHQPTLCLWVTLCAVNHERGPPP